MTKNGKRLGGPEPTMPVVKPQNARMKNSKQITLGFLSAALALASGLAAATALAESAPTHALASPKAANEANATYLRDVLPIVMGKCVRCHNTESQMLPNWLDYKTAFAKKEEIKRRVWDSWKGRYYKQSMPAGTGPECESMTEEERATIKAWVAEGAPLGVPPSSTHPQSKPERMQQGQRLFGAVCALCHQPNAQGVPGKFPPLVRSDFLNADKARAIKILLHGRQGEIVVNGQKFNNSMPMFPLSDEDVASALTYVYNSFGNSGYEVTAEEVKALRAQPADQAPASTSNVAQSPAEKSEFE